MLQEQAFDGDAVLQRIGQSIPSASIDASATSIRVLLVDCQRVVLEGLAALLMMTRGVRVVGIADDAATALRMFDERTPDVCVVDLRLHPTDNATLTAQMRARRADARVIVLTECNTVEQVYSGVRAGASSYLLKNVDSTTLVETIGVVHSGQRAITTGVAAKLAEHVSSESLTDRQSEVLQSLAEGNSNLVIAKRLGVSEGTIKAHMKAILQKLGARDRTHATSLAFQRGLVFT